MEQIEAAQAFLQDAILCHPDVLCFPEFAGADRISVSEIDRCITNLVPPAILTKQRRLLPIQAKYREVLMDFCRAHQIMLVEWQDNWSMILDEFLDTELPSQVQECNYRKLEQVGISRSYCDEIRAGIIGALCCRTMRACGNGVIWGLTTCSGQQRDFCPIQKRHILARGWNSSTVGRWKLRACSRKI